MEDSASIPSLLPSDVVSQLAERTLLASMKAYPHWRCMMERKAEPDAKIKRR